MITIQIITMTRTITLIMIIITIITIIPKIAIIIVTIPKIMAGSQWSLVYGVIIPRPNK
jgi:hypothetical protein